MSIFNKVKKVALTIIEKLNIYIKSANTSVDKIKMLKITGVAAGAILCVAIFSTFFTTGYEVFLGNEKVAVVYNKAQFETNFACANNKIVEIAGKGYGITKIPKYVFTVAAKSIISENDEIVKNIMAQSNSISLVYYINVDGENVAYAESEQEAKKFLELAAATYSGENRQILNDVKITSKYEKLKYFPGEKIAVKNLITVLKVQTESEQQYKAEIACGRIENKTDEMYINEEKVVTEGKNGVMEVTARVTKINGTASDVNVISSTVIKNPEEEVVMVGSMALPSVGTGEFIQPFYGVITSRFGARWGRTHTGTDIAGETGSPIKAADNGVVITAEYQDNGYGNIIIIDHNNGFVTYYAHLNKIDVKEGDTVEKGSIIGELGNTGFSTGPHLHFEVRENGTPVDPGNFLEDIN